MSTRIPRALKRLKKFPERLKKTLAKWHRNFDCWSKAIAMFVIKKWKALPDEKCLSQTLVMTLLVKDEIDIISAVIEFHRMMGVDHIFITDNGSTDGTRQALENYSKEDFVTLIDEPSTVYQQEKWVNRMANMAFERFGSCLIFHADADEFWYSRSGNLKLELARKPGLDSLLVPIMNVMLQDKGGKECFPQDSVYVQVRPDNNYWHSYKAFIKAKTEMPQVVTGNHHLVGGANYRTINSTDMVIFHHVVRSYKRFVRKATDDATALMANEEYNKTGAGGHWRDFNKAHLAGKGLEIYKEYALSNAIAENLIDEGSIVKIENLTARLLRGDAISEVSFIQTVP